MNYRYSYIFTALLALGLITLIAQVFKTGLGLVNIALIHLIPIMVVSLRGNFLATSFIAMIAIVFFNVLYVPPVYSFNVYDVIYFWSFAIFLLVGYIITWQAQKIQTNEIRDILLSTLSHDLKTPLSSILGSTTLLLEDTKMSEHARRNLLNDIKHSSDKMHRLINNLLDNARLKDKRLKLHMNWCDLEDSLNIALNDFEESYIERHVTVDISPNLELYWGDENLLNRLFANLLDNAFKYSNQNKQIVIRLFQEPKKVKITFFNESNPFKEHALKSMFDRFYRLENTGDISGSGIGLFICHSIVTAHGGKISAYNQYNGICFEITLPIAKRPKNLQNEL
ncbi:sensor histidine kinase [Sulfurospirillum barnesii]|uniref:histidine kinase n=1 Tax=Sulfurospirillum barnesii (strain ATCC 700032 / DSM 10660 / SES-3) TaxID=760154 RepID=I3XXY4_SULBS|nr:ATP-binding protein [Sulfurospirillum barnesii]AFL68808.1 histidine kinase [Sulfurospirillum barnesii SES-3]